MIPHPAALDAAYGRDVFEPLSRVTFLDPAGVASAPVPVISGNVAGDADRWPRWSATVTVPTAVTPSKTQPPVSPYGGRCQLEVGWRVRGVDYWYRAATLDVIETDLSRPEGTITMRCGGAESRIAEYLDDNPDAVSPAGTASAVITALVTPAHGPGLVVRNLLTTDPTYAAGAFRVGENRWQAVEDIATASDAEAYFDHLGQLIIRPTPTAAGTPVVQLYTGDGGTLTGYRSVRGWAANRVRIAYDDGTNRVTGVWAATTGPLAAASYGRHAWRDTVNVDAGKLPTVAVANRHAAAMAKRLALAARSVELSAVPVPWLEPGDTVAVTLMGTNATEGLLVTSVDWPVGGLDLERIVCRDPAATGATVVVAQHKAHPPHPPHP